MTKTGMLADDSFLKILYDRVKSAWKINFDEKNKTISSRINKTQAVIIKFYQSRQKFENRPIFVRIWLWQARIYQEDKN